MDKTDKTAILKRIKAENIRFMDLRFTDMRGAWHHLTVPADAMDKTAWERGVVCDAPLLGRGESGRDSDIILCPDIETAHNEPFFAEPSLAVFCDVKNSATNKIYSFDPRGIARRCEDYTRETGFADAVRLSLGAEFFVFDDARFEISPYHSFCRLDAAELPANSGREYAMGNSGYRPGKRGGAVLPPADSGQDMRSEMLAMLKDMGIEALRHCHGASAAQHRISIGHDGLLRQADKMQMLKYAVRQVAAAYGRSATFMPKPVFGAAGSGMPTVFSLLKNGKPIFAGKEYAGLSRTALYFIGGILRHMRALNAFTNPSTNSYKRLTGEIAAPAAAGYSAVSRSAACYIPHSFSDNVKQVEVRFPDPAANPYFAFSALLMAGLDGIKHNIDPGAPMEMDGKEASLSFSASLTDALNALDKDREFLKAGGVFDDKLLDSYIALKRQEARRIESAPYPAEFDMYYSL